ncbi:MAG: Na+/H+ antiporter NhaA [Ignavibacteria bacterium]|nr:Na+/H+ antiporter NhaA [Ignavibacteria bacterium]
MSIFITNLSFDNSLFINESKLAVLLGSLISSFNGSIVVSCNKREKTLNSGADPCKLV